MDTSSDATSIHYFQALQRYKEALERGDLETVAALLHKAEHDARLEHLLLEIHTRYEVEDHTRPEYHEVIQARNIFHATVKAHFAQLDGVEVTPESTQVIMHTPASTKPSTVSSKQEKMQLSQRIKPLSMFVQTLAAVLVIALLSTGFLILKASRQAHVGSPTSSAKTVAAITRDGTITTFNAQTGAVLWRYATGHEIVNDETGLIIKDETLYALNTGHIYALNLTNGSLRWQTAIPLTWPTFIVPYDRFILDNGIIYIGESEGPDEGHAGPVVGAYGDLYALSASNGKQLWKYHSNEYPLVGIKDGIVYVRNQEGDSGHATVQALRGTDGTVLWTHSHLDEFVMVGDDQTLYTASDNWATKQTTWKAIKRDGSVTLLYTIDHSMFSGNYHIHIDKNFLIYEDDGAQFCVYQLDTGDRQWCNHKNDVQLFGGDFSNGTFTESTFYSVAIAKMGSSQSNIGKIIGATMLSVTARRASDGRVLWSKQYSGQEMQFNDFPGPPVADNMVIVDLAKRIYALNATTGDELWHTNLAEIYYTTIG